MDTPTYTEYTESPDATDYVISDNSNSNKDHVDIPSQPDQIKSALKLEEESTEDLLFSKSGTQESNSSHSSVLTSFILQAEDVDSKEYIQASTDSNPHIFNSSPGYYSYLRKDSSSVKLTGFSAKAKILNEFLDLLAADVDVYRDLTIVCCDGNVDVPRLLIAAAFTQLSDVLLSVPDHAGISLPDVRRVDVLNMLHTLCSDPLNNHLNISQDVLCLFCLGSQEAMFGLAPGMGVNPQKLDNTEDDQSQRSPSYVPNEEDILEDETESKHKKEVMPNQTRKLTTESGVCSQQTEINCKDITQVCQSKLAGKLLSYQQACQLAYAHMGKSGKSFVCKKCNKVFSRIIGNCREHIWRAHFNIYIFKCPTEGCSRKFRKLTDYKDHCKQHEEREEARLRLVENRVGDLPQDAKYHLADEPIDVTKEEGWRIAGLYFYQDPVIRKHRCKLCTFSHQRVQATRHHILANHLVQLFIHRCPHCQKRFRYESQYKLHLKVHTEGRFICSLCGKQLLTKRYLVQHELTAHQNMTMVCQEKDCTYRGKTKAQMERHRKIYHTKDKSDWHFCEACGKPFAYQNELKAHLPRCLQGHSHVFRKERYTKYIGENSDGFFTCSLCSHIAKSYRSVVEHIKKSHSTDGEPISQETFKS